MGDRRQMSFLPENEQAHDGDHDQPVGDHPGGGLGDEDWFPPDPNYLAQFRKPMTEADMDEMVRAFEEVVIEFLTECEAKEPPR